jgi:hypothetical protein
MTERNRTSDEENKPIVTENAQFNPLNSWLEQGEKQDLTGLTGAQKATLIGLQLSKNMEQAILKSNSEKV